MQKENKVLRDEVTLYKAGMIKLAAEVKKLRGQEKKEEVKPEVVEEKPQEEKVEEEAPQKSAFE